MAPRMTGWRFIPLVLFAAIVGAMVWRLASPPTRDVESKMVGRPLPTFDLPAAIDAKPGLHSADLKSVGGPRLINIFASWCVPCATEAGVLMQLKRRGVEVDGIAIRDRPDALGAFLARYGDPYARIGADDQSEVQIALGSSGVPESFIVDGRGIIRYQHIGPIAAGEVSDILARLDQAK